MTDVDKPLSTEPDLVSCRTGSRTRTVKAMRWDELFGDLDVAADGLAQRDRDLEIAERTRTELSGIAMADRLRAGVGAVVTLQVSGVGRLEGRLSRVTPQWLLLDPDGRHGWAVALSALVGVEGLSTAAAPAHTQGAVGSRTTWGSAFRVLSREREVVVLRCLDGSSVRGVPARVGLDFVEMWQRADDGAGSSGPGQRLTVGPYTAVAAVSLRTGDA